MTNAESNRTLLKWAKENQSLSHAIELGKNWYRSIKNPMSTSVRDNDTGAVYDPGFRLDHTAGLLGQLLSVGLGFAGIGPNTSDAFNKAMQKPYSSPAERTDRQYPWQRESLKFTPNYNWHIR